MKTSKFAIVLTILGAAAQLVPAQTTTFNPLPSRIVGQAALQQQGLITTTAPNLVEGREFNSPQALAIDTSVNPPILYVADSGNNRVLAWKNAFGFTKGDPADKVIGQNDFLSTAAKGPGSDLSTGLFEPLALTVDQKGNLYVVDSGNNRIVRYPAPFSQTGDSLIIDLVIGQPDLNNRAPNQGKAAPTEKTLLLFGGAGLNRSGIVFDLMGNLWVTDPGNNRVLRYPASSLGSDAANQPSADLVLGQPDFVSSALPTSAATPAACGTSAIQSVRCGKNFLAQPSGLAFDQKGRLFVADLDNRVVVYTPPFMIGQLISRILGVDFGAPPQPPPTISATTLGSPNVPPEGVFFIGNNPYVVDTANARILKYDPFDNWADEATAFSPPAKAVIGQLSFTASLSNQGMPRPSASSFAGPQPNSLISGPVAAAFAGNDLFVVDSGNNRILVFPQQPGGTFTSANRLLGQVDFQYNSVNLIEGREVGFTGNIGSCSFNGGLPFTVGGGVAIDVSSNPPHLYIADPLNNRILGYKDYRKVNAGTTADLVVGQPDLYTALVNFPSNSATQVTDAGLWSPESVTVDSNGNLYVADTCNARVLRFPKPFDQPQGVPEHANLVLGQAGFFNQPIKDVGKQTMRSSYGLAFTADGSLLVSDPLANRVLYFKKPAGGDFQNGQSAANVIGQPDFRSSTATIVSNGGANPGGLSNPHGIAVDPDDRLLVADTNNGRIAIFPNIPTAGDNPPVIFSLTSLSSPTGVAIDNNTGEIWATNTNGGQLLRFPKYPGVIANGTATAVLSVIGPLAVALDPFGDPIVAEGINRVAFYFPAIDFTNSAAGLAGRSSGNGANYFPHFAPGMLASIFAFTNKRFADQPLNFNTLPNPLPIPTTLGDLQVLVAGIPSPVLYVSAAQINFQVPMATPLGLQEIQVVRASTGQVIASWFFRIESVSPGLFSADGTGTGQVAAVNADGFVNSGAHPAKAGTVISFYATGQGVVNGAPPDGQPAPLTPLLMTNQKPRVFINGPDFLADADVQFSGLAPGLVGVWQINAKIPADAPTGDVIVFIELQGVNSSLEGATGVRRRLTIRVTQ